jgi:hypothetical protein
VDVIGFVAAVCSFSIVDLVLRAVRRPRRVLLHAWRKHRRTSGPGRHFQDDRFPAAVGVKADSVPSHQLSIALRRARLVFDCATVNLAMADPKIKERIASLGGSP